MNRRLPLFVSAMFLVGACAAPTAAAPDPTAIPAVEAAASASAAPVSKVLEITAFDLGFTPATLDVPAPGKYQVKLTNTGATTHDITFATGETATAQPGETVALMVDIPAGGTTFLCAIPGHAVAGMTGGIVVTGSAPSPTMDPNSHGGPAPTTDVAADPNAPNPVRYDPTAPKALPGNVHDIDLVMTEQEMTVAEGFVQKVWTFGGTVPGPVIRVHVGDSVRVHLKNPKENQMSHSIDFHASQ
ncbi:MAG TPA: multicopper oxidase domain-containing protein, partial [Candidatus Limnocylindrales bacterium]|nr:multicopper oxidase domain-containing protein [Candidatus Limnocylindrales bacterium]